MKRPPSSEPASWGGVGFSFAGALCSALYLFPYKRASHFAAPDALAFALLLVAAVLNTALLGVQWPRGNTGPKPRLLAFSGSEADPAPVEVNSPGAPPRLRNALRTGPKPRLLLQDRRSLWSVAAGLSLATVSGNFCGAHAVAQLDPAITSVLLRTEVVFVGCLGVVLVGERFTPALVLGALTALGGLGIMRWPLEVGSSHAGPLWALGAAASFGFMQVLTRRFIDRISPVAVNAVRLWMAVLMMALWPGVIAGVLQAGTAFWQNIALAGLFGPFLGRLFIMFSLRTLRAAHSALLLLLAPVLAFGFGYLTTGVTPTALELAGGALMLTGIALPSLGREGSRGQRV